MFEAGLMEEWLQHTSDTFTSHIQQSVRLFQSLEDYVNAYSSSISSKIYFSNLRNVLGFFFAAQLLVLSLLMAPILVRFIGRLFCEIKMLLGRLYRRLKQFGRKIRRSVRKLF